MYEAKRRGKGGFVIHAPGVEGVSLVPAFKGESLNRGKPIFWEHEGNRAVRDGQWKLVHHQSGETPRPEADLTEPDRTLQ